MSQASKPHTTFTKFFFWVGRDLKSNILEMCPMDSLSQFGHVNHESRKCVQFYLRERLRRFLAPFIPQGHLTYQFHKSYWVKLDYRLCSDIHRSHCPHRLCNHWLCCPQNSPKWLCDRLEPARPKHRSSSIWNTASHRFPAQHRLQPHRQQLATNHNYRNNQPFNLYQFRWKNNHHHRE